jgi:hypothetical protein
MLNMFTWTASSSHPAQIKPLTAMTKVVEAYYDVHIGRLISLSVVGKVGM